MGVKHIIENVNKGFEASIEETVMLVKEIERYEKALEEISRQYNDTTVNRAKEIANKALGELSEDRKREIQSYTF